MWDENNSELQDGAPTDRPMPRPSSRPTNGCPTPASIAQWVESHGEARDPSAIGRHVEGCSRCRQEAEMARVFLRPDQGPQISNEDLAWVRTRAMQPFVRRRIARRKLEWALAGVAGLAATAVFWIAGPRDSKPPAIAGIEQGEVVHRGSSDPDAAPRILWPTGRLLAPPDELRFEPADAGTAHVVTIRDAGGHEIFRAVATGGSVRLTDAPRIFSRAGEYSWRVEERRIGGGAESREPAPAHATFVITTGDHDDRGRGDRDDDRRDDDRRGDDRRGDGENGPR